MKKSLLTAFFFGVVFYSLAQLPANPITVTSPTSTATYSGTTYSSSAQQLNQDDATGNIGIGYASNGNNITNSCALSVSNMLFNTTPAVGVLGVMNYCSTSGSNSGNSPYSFLVIRSTPGTVPNAIAYDFGVDNNGLVGIGAPAADFNTFFATAGYSGSVFGVIDPNSTGTRPLITIATNANNPTTNSIAALTVDYRGYTSLGQYFPNATNPAHLFLTDPVAAGTDPLIQVVTNQSTQAMLIASNGYVGIGTATPAYPLDVKGNTNVGGTLNVGSHTANGDMGQIALDAVGLGAGSYANLIQVSNPAVKAFAINQQCQASGCTGTTDQFVIYADGHTVIGGTQPQTTAYTPFALAVAGTIVAKQVQVETSDWADKVFDKTYPLMPLSQVEDYLNANKHLPEIPSETEVIERGINLGEMNKLLLQKVEELTLYLIKQQKEIDALKIQK